MESYHWTSCEEARQRLPAALEHVYNEAQTNALAAKGEGLGPQHFFDLDSDFGKVRVIVSAHYQAMMGVVVAVSASVVETDLELNEALTAFIPGLAEKVISTGAICALLDVLPESLSGGERRENSWLFSLPGRYRQQRLTWAHEKAQEKTRADSEESAQASGGKD